MNFVQDKREDEARISKHSEGNQQSYERLKRFWLLKRYRGKRIILWQ